MIEAELESLLNSLGLNTIKRNNNLMACCPNHNERRPSWGISIREPHMHGCFSCGFKGSLASLLKFYNWTPNQIESITGPQTVVPSSVDFSFAKVANKPKEVESFMLYPYKVNIRLRAYAYSRGLTEDTIRSANLLYEHVDNRMLIPWYLEDTLIGATGRTLSKDPTVPKIVVYFGLQKEQSLYIPNRRIDSTKPLILVEGEIDALKVFQAGYTNVAALAFGSFTKSQLAQIYGSSVEELCLFFDNDTTGQRLTADVRRMIDNSLSIRTVSYPMSQTKQDPGAMTDAQIQKLLTSTFKKSRFSLVF